ncbi:MAG: phosphoribosylformylglycinamidine synthase I [Planctomycetota bacterium]
MTTTTAPTKTVQTLLLRTAGTNCDAEAQTAFELAGSHVARMHLNALVAAPARLEKADILMLAGGFSYGDYIAAGRIFGRELEAHLTEALQRFVERGGLVLGVCNGFQVLVELGLLEGVGADPAARSLALTDNASAEFECRWVTLREEDSACAWLEPGRLVPVPVAHAEGRLVVRDDATLARLRANRQIALRYVAPDGGPAAYPGNPNGSVDDIAGLCDPSGRVLGLMPHPERNLSRHQHPRWTRLAEREEGEGLAFFRRMVAVARDSR